jgi:hypothetical protein
LLTKSACQASANHQVHGSEESGEQQRRYSAPKITESQNKAIFGYPDSWSAGTRVGFFGASDLGEGRVERRQRANVSKF